jgi:hypothetical protein
MKKIPLAKKILFVLLAVMALQWFRQDVWWGNFLENEHLGDWEYVQITLRRVLREMCCRDGKETGSKLYPVMSDVTF